MSLRTENVTGECLWQAKYRFLLNLTSKLNGAGLCLDYISTHLWGWCLNSKFFLIRSILDRLLSLSFLWSWFNRGHLLQQEELQTLTVFFLQHYLEVMHCYLEIVHTIPKGCRAFLLEWLYDPWSTSRSSSSIPLCPAGGSCQVLPAWVECKPWVLHLLTQLHGV